MTENKKKLLVIGGGISGMTVAVEAAEVGYETILVEKEAYLGGRVAKMHRYFPKMCPPTCGMEINFKRIKNNPRITVHTLANVKKVSGEPGNYQVTIEIAPRYVKEHAHISNETLEKISSQRPDDFNMGMKSSKALYYPHAMAYPPQYVLDKKALSDADLNVLKSECPDALDLDAAPEEITIEVGAIVVAAGWEPYDAKKIENLGFGKCANVITNVMMERLASPAGPTEGKMVRPSDGKEIRKIAFVQCAGSRDERHLPYCSAVCCMGSLKQTRYVLDAAPGAQVTVFYIDVRPVGRHEKFYYDLLDNERVTFVKGKVGAITEDSASKDVVIEVEDTIQGRKLKETFDLAVLATGMQPATAVNKIPIEGLTYDTYGFVDLKDGVKGIFSAGCVQRPVDVARSVRQATGVALKAIQGL